MEYYIHGMEESPMPPVSKKLRFAEFIRQLGALPPASNHDEAFRQLEETLNQTEDEQSGVPFDPARWRTDGRMYPPQSDSASDVEGYPDLISYRSRRHETTIAKNGAFEIRDVQTGEVVLHKPGRDGKGVWS
jgi:hypothetical protein